MNVVSLLVPVCWTKVPFSLQETQPLKHVIGVYKDVITGVCDKPSELTQVSLLEAPGSPDDECGWSWGGPP